MHSIAPIIHLLGMSLIFIAPIAVTVILAVSGMRVFPSQRRLGVAYLCMSSLIAGSALVSFLPAWLPEGVLLAIHGSERSEILQNVIATPTGITPYLLGAYLIFLGSRRLRSSSRLIRSLLMASGVIIVATSAALWIRRINPFREEDPQREATNLTLGKIRQGLQMYRIHLRRLPSTDQGLKSLIEKNSNEQDWRGPYVDHAWLVDPAARIMKIGNE